MRRALPRSPRVVRHLRVVVAVRRPSITVAVRRPSITVAVRRLAIAIATFVAAVSVGSTALAAPHTEAVAPPAKRVYVVSDSVGLGAKSAIPAAFPDDWQVTVDGTPALFVEQLLSKHVRPARGVLAGGARRLCGRRRRLQLPVLGPGALRPLGRHDGRQPARPRRAPRVLGDAAASDTAPRMPAPADDRPLPPVRPPRALLRAPVEQPDQPGDHVHPQHPRTITAARRRRPRAAARPRPPCDLVEDRGSCRPMSTNSSALSRKVRTSHTA